MCIRDRDARKKYKSYYDDSHRDIKYEIGQKVWVRNHDLSIAAEGYMKKLGKKWLGPFVITEKVNPVAYITKDARGKVIGKRHVNDLKIFVERGNYASASNLVNNNVSSSVGSNRSVNPVDIAVQNGPRRSNRVRHVPGTYRDRLRP